MLPAATCSGVIRRGLRPARTTSTLLGMTGVVTSVCPAPATHQCRRSGPSAMPGCATFRTPTAPYRFTSPSQVTVIAGTATGAASAGCTTAYIPWASTGCCRNGRSRIEPTLQQKASHRSGTDRWKCRSHVLRYWPDCDWPTSTRQRGAMPPRTGAPAGSRRRRPTWVTMSQTIPSSHPSTTPNGLTSGPTGSCGFAGSRSHERGA